MGILGLSKLIGDYAPSAMKESEFKTFFGRKVAVDASMSLYQFLIAVRQEGAQLTSADGETTSHLMGFFYRTIRMIDNGIKPVYVFDGKPPQMKSGELEKRKERREEAQKLMDAAKEAGDMEEVDRQSKRIVKVSKTHVEEAQKLLTLMGVPFVNAPSEAEAQCAALQKSGKVYGVATEDMDALTFGTQNLLRHLTFSESRKMPVQVYHLDRVLQELEFSMDEFIDLCILLGCDYCDSIRGIGPKKAVELIKEYRNIEAILEFIKRYNKAKAEKFERTKKGSPKGYIVPDFWPYEQARHFFKDPEITDPAELEFTWSAPDTEAVVEYMVNEKGFAEDRIRNGCKKLEKARTTSTQGRLDSFFKVLPPPAGSTNGKKRPADTKAKGKDEKKAKGGGGGGFRRGK